MRAFLSLMIVLAFTASSAEAGRAVIANKCTETLQIGVYCRDHRRWEPIVGNFVAASVVSNRSVQLPNLHAGNYTITAKTWDNVQVQEEVVVKEAMNKFSIYYVPRQVPGMPPVRSLGISRDPDKVEDDGAGRGGADQAEPAVPGGETYVPHMGIYYTPVPYADGTFGARLTRDAAPGTPAGQIQLSTGPSRLEQGDTIFEMDGLRFRTAADFRNHRAYTTMRFIDVRTGSTYGASFNLP